VPLRLSLILPSGAITRHAEVAVEDTVIAGWTGRDPAAVAKHVRELEALGVKAPATTPIFYRVATARLTTRTNIEVVGTKSGGEVEFVLLQYDGRLWVAPGPTTPTARSRPMASPCRSRCATSRWRRCSGRSTTSRRTGIG
jgi:uncharacterized protein DUF2848